MLEIPNENSRQNLNLLLSLENVNIKRAFKNKNIFLQQIFSVLGGVPPLAMPTPMRSSECISWVFIITPEIGWLMGSDNYLQQ